MKKVIFLAVAMIFVSSVCFAQMGKPATHPKPGMPVPAAKMETGKVVSVTMADAVKKIRPGIVITTDNAKEETFVVAASAVIIGSDMKPVKLDALAKDTKVQITYHTSAKGTMLATAIKVVK